MTNKVKKFTVGDLSRYIALAKEAKDFVNQGPFKYNATYEGNQNNADNEIVPSTISARSVSILSHAITKHSFHSAQYTEHRDSYWKDTLVDRQNAQKEQDDANSDIESDENEKHFSLPNDIVISHHEIADLRKFDLGFDNEYINKVIEKKNRTVDQTTETNEKTEERRTPLTRREQIDNANARIYDEQQIRNTPFANLPEVDRRAGSSLKRSDGIEYESRRLIRMGLRLADLARTTKGADNRDESVAALARCLDVKIPGDEQTAQSTSEEERENLQRVIALYSELQEKIKFDINIDHEATSGLSEQIENTVADKKLLKLFAQLHELKNLEETQKLTTEQQRENPNHPRLTEDSLIPSLLNLAKNGGRQTIPTPETPFQKFMSFIRREKTLKQRRENLYKQLVLHLNSNIDKAAQKIENFQHNKKQKVLNFLGHWLFRLPFVLGCAITVFAVILLTYGAFWWGPLLALAMATITGQVNWSITQGIPQVLKDVFSGRYFKKFGDGLDIYPDPKDGFPRTLPEATTKSEKINRVLAKVTPFASALCVGFLTVFAVIAVPLKLATVQTPWLLWLAHAMAAPAIPFIIWPLAIFLGVTSFVTFLTLIAKEWRGLLQTKAHEKDSSLSVYDKCRKNIREKYSNELNSEDLDISKTNTGSEDKKLPFLRMRIEARIQWGLRWILPVCCTIGVAGLVYAASVFALATIFPLSFWVAFAIGAPIGIVSFIGQFPFYLNNCHKACSKFAGGLVNGPRAIISLFSRSSTRPHGSDEAVELLNNPTHPHVETSHANKVLFFIPKQRNSKGKAKEDKFDRPLIDINGCRGYFARLFKVITGIISWLFGGINAAGNADIPQPAMEGDGTPRGNMAARIFATIFGVALFPITIFVVLCAGLNSFYAYLQSKITGDKATQKATVKNAELHLALNVALKAYDALETAGFDFQAALNAQEPGLQARPDEQLKNAQSNSLYEQLLDEQTHGGTEGAVVGAGVGGVSLDDIKTVIAQSPEDVAQHSEVNAQPLGAAIPPPLTAEDSTATVTDLTQAKVKMPGPPTKPKPEGLIRGKKVVNTKAGAAEHANSPYFPSPQSAVRDGFVNGAAQGSVSRWEGQDPEKGAHSDDYSSSGSNKSGAAFFGYTNENRSGSRSASNNEHETADKVGETATGFADGVEKIAAAMRQSSLG